MAKFLEEWEARESLILEALAFQAETDQSWILSYNEHDTFRNWVCFHVYRIDDALWMRTFEVIDLWNLELVQRDHLLDAGQCAAFERAWQRMTLAMPFELGSRNYIKDGSRQSLKCAFEGIQEFHWEFPTKNFDLLQRLIQVLHQTDGWVQGAVHGFLEVED